MSDLREVAARFREMRRLSDAFDGGYPRNADGRAQALSDAVALAEAWLAEHPADEDEPCDRDWLQSVGGEDSGAIVFYGPCFHLLVGPEPAAYLYDPDDGEQVPIPFPETKCRFRRLAAALGVPLKEGR